MHLDPPSLQEKQQLYRCPKEYVDFLERQKQHIAKTAMNAPEDKLVFQKQGAYQVIQELIDSINATRR